MAQLMRRQVLHTTHGRMSPGVCRQKVALSAPLAELLLKSDSSAKQHKVCSKSRICILVSHSILLLGNPSQLMFTQRTTLYLHNQTVRASPIPFWACDNHSLQCKSNAYACVTLSFLAAEYHVQQPVHGRSDQHCCTPHPKQQAPAPGSQHILASKHRLHHSEVPDRTLFYH